MTVDRRATTQRLLEVGLLALSLVYGILGSVIGIAGLVDAPSPVHALVPLVGGVALAGACLALVGKWHREAWLAAAGCATSALALIGGSSSLLGWVPLLMLIG